jgi:hypothetical protein
MICRFRLMTKFFFHTRDGDHYTKDEEGTDLPDLEAAHDEAVLAAREMMAEMLITGKLVDGQQFEIATEDGTVVEIFAFKSALRLP